MNDTGLKAVAGLKALRQLDLAYCWRVTDDGIRALQQLPVLSHLDLAYCWQVAACCPHSSIPEYDCKNFLPPGCKSRSFCFEICVHLDLAYCWQVAACCPQSSIPQYMCKNPLPPCCKPWSFYSIPEYKRKSPLPSCCRPSSFPFRNLCSPLTCKPKVSSSLPCLCKKKVQQQNDGIGCV